MTTTDAGLELGLLGPLEAQLGGAPLPLGGAKQRAVLAVLLLSADEAVPISRLIDEVWGDAPPPSAPHSLEVYVSRLRRLLEGHGPTLQRQGAGYRLCLGSASLDARSFARLSEDTALATAMGDDEGAANLARAALALWRGPVLADITLSSSGRADSERLEELRLRTYEQLFDADLALCRHHEITGELQALVDQHPYRERFVAQVMIALYRSGRHVEALQAYERLRRALADDVGLQPSVELQQLSGRIVRQDPELGAPARTAPQRASIAVRAKRQSVARPRRRRVLALAATTMALAVMLAAGGAASAPGTAAAPDASRVALVLPTAPSSGQSLDIAAMYDVAVQASGVIGNGPWPTTFVARDDDPRRVDAVAARLREGGYGLVLWVGDGSAARRILPTVQLVPRTRFVFLDASAETLGIAGLPNASAVRFAEEQTAELVGYMSGLVGRRLDPLGAKVDTIGYVGGEDTPEARAAAAALERGLRRARPRGSVLVGFSHDLHDRTACERLANEQVDHGADVVFADAGDCGLGALAVAAFRGVWGVADEDGMSDRDASDRRILTRRFKEPRLAVQLAVRSYVDHTLPPGGEQTLGLQDDYAVGLANVNLHVPENVWSRVVDLCSDLRRHASKARPKPQPDAAAAASAGANRISPSSE